MGDGKSERCLMLAELELDTCWDRHPCLSPCMHDVNAANLAALSKDHPVLGMELHAFIGEQGNMFHVCEPPNAEDVVWHIRGVFYTH